MSNESDNSKALWCYVDERKFCNVDEMAEKQGITVTQAQKTLTAMFFTSEVTFREE